MLPPLAVLLLVSCLRPNVQPKAGQDAPYGRYTEMQILARAEPLCRALAPRAAKLQLTASSVGIQSRRGAPLEFWEAQCTDQAGIHIASFIWYADTGDLRRVGRTWPTASAVGTEPLNRGEAEQAARFWLRALGITEKMLPWRLASEPERISGVWRAQWQAGGRIAEIRIHAHSGDLILFNKWRSIR
jgi:hypothetical protein